MTSLSKRRLWAIENALTLSLAGAIETKDPGREDYQKALLWAQEEMARRRRKRPVDEPPKM
jgi:hypothetical protein